MKKIVRIIGVILSTAAGVLMVLGLLGITQVGSCGDIGEQVCPAGTGADVFMLIGGSFLLTIGAIMTLGVGVFASCLAAAIILLVKGNGAVTTIIATALIVIPGLVLLGMLGARRTAATRAIQTAQFKQRAIMVPGIVTAVRDTGVTINDNPRVGVMVSYQRIDGTAAEYERKSVVSRLSIPSPGERATVWYDPSGSNVVVELGQPALSADLPGAYAAELARSVGVSDSLPSAPFQNAEPEDSVPGSPTIVADLESLAALRRDGSLSEYEYSLAKQRLLNGA